MTSCRRPVARRMQQPCHNIDTRHQTFRAQGDRQNRGKTRQGTGHYSDVNLNPTSLRVVVEREEYQRFSNSHCSSNFGTFSTRCSTIASGPFSTCKPCGIAYVLIPGLAFWAITWICVACSEVHMDAQNCCPGFCQHGWEVAQGSPGNCQYP